VTHQPRPSTNAERMLCAGLKRTWSAGRVARHTTQQAQRNGPGMVTIPAVSSSVFDAERKMPLTGGTNWLPGIV